MDKKWKNGKRRLIEYNKIIEIIRKVSSFKDHLVIVGSDSVKLGEEFVFANAICILNKDNYYDRRFFYLRRRILDDTYYNLSKRLLKETEESINIASDLQEKVKGLNIEIHSDINFDEKYPSSKMKNTIIGYINGCGFDCKIKPDSFVASGIADRYTRKN